MLPQEFIDSIAQCPILAPLQQSLLTEPDVSVRLNTRKLGGKKLSMNNLDISPDECAPVAWCDSGIYMPRRPLFTADPQLHQGLYYVQDASSMAITAAIDAIIASMPEPHPLRFLDCCAAPGGKTTAAASRLPQGSLIVANEYDYKRAQILAENLSKWGLSAAMATRGDTSALLRLPSFFDIVAVDAPCSGEGMMRKDDKARQQWSAGLVKSCAKLQREILANAYAALRPGGWLIYSTCTFNRHENEENAEWLTANYPLTPVPIPALDAIGDISRGIDTTIPCYRFIPGRVRGEGLFLVLMRKDADAPASRCVLAKQPQDANVPKEVRNWVVGKHIWRIIGNDIYAWPQERAQEMATVADELDAFMPGLHVATIKGKDAIPAHELALSPSLNPMAFPMADISGNEALAYLRREAVTVDAPKGYVLLTHCGFPLGFVKNLGNRANNLYPKNWRIHI